MEIYANGTIHTMVPSGRIAGALGVEGGRIVAVGSEEEVNACATGPVEHIDLEGGALCPGFIDAHHHFALAALLARSPDLGASEVRAVADLVSLVRARAVDTPPGRWILAGGYDEMRLDEKRPPTREELDAVSPGHPVLLLQYTCHEGVANSRAFREAGIPFAQPDPAHGVIERDRGGAPTGRLIEAALSRILRLAWEGAVMADEDAYHDALVAYQRALWSRGVARVGDPGVWPGMEVCLRRASAQGILRMPLTMMPVGEGGFYAPPADRLAGTPTGEGNEWLRIGPLKLFMDGGRQVGVVMRLPELAASLARNASYALSHRTFDPFRQSRDVRLRPGRDGRIHAGLLFYGADEARRLCEQAQERGFTIAIHAIGNEAVGRALGALPASRPDRPVGVPPNRIEHFLIIDHDHIRRAAEKGIAATVQPTLLERVGDDIVMAGFPGPGRFLPLRSMLDAGLCVAGSSDAPVIDFDPLRAMWTATTRRTAGGVALDEAEAIGPLEALALYTRNAAAAMGVERECGTLEIGKRADLVWLTRDPAGPGALDPGAGGTRVRGTWVGGERVC